MTGDFSYLKFFRAMARPKKRNSEKLVQIPANITPKMVKMIRSLAVKHEWSVAQTVRKMIELGLNVELSNTPKNRAARIEQ